MKEGGNVVSSPPFPKYSDLVVKFRESGSDGTRELLLWEWRGGG